jgi:hypothetical protein
MRKEKYMSAKKIRRKAVVSKIKKGKPVAPRFLRFPILQNIWNWLCWVTNNEKKPKHEVEFDMVFFIANTLTLVIGAPLMLLAGKETAPFAALLIIEYTWSLDTLRNNRDYIK